MCKLQKWFFGIFLVILCTVNSSVADDASIGLYYGVKPVNQYVFRSSTILSDNPEDGECGESEFGRPDKVLIFKFEGVNTKVKINDPRVYADGGSATLLDWISAFQDKGALDDVGMDQYTNAIVTTSESDLGGGIREIRACVGSSIHENHTDEQLKKIYLWYSMENIDSDCENSEQQVWDTQERKWKCVEQGGTSTGGQDPGSGNGYNDTTDNTPISNSHDSGGSDLSISNCYVSEYGKDKWRHKLTKTLRPGQYFYIEAEGRVRNEGDEEAEDVDWDWRIDHSRKRFDRDDTKIDEVEVDIDPGEKEKEHLRRTMVRLSSDGRSLRAQGPDGSESFDVVNGQAKFYIFIDVENDDDDDISSRNSWKHEYAVVEVNLPDFTSRFNFNKSGGQAPVTIDFSNTSKGDGTGISYMWNFGDGSYSSAKSSSHTFTQAGTFVVSLTANSTWGESRVSSAQITVSEPYVGPIIRCPADMRRCTDGTYVGRDLGTCEFNACPPGTEDMDQDGIANIDEIGDADGDGIPDNQEQENTDYDNDGVVDQHDAENTDATNDSDDDSYSNQEEVVAGTDPLDENSKPAELVDDPENYCHETEATATNGGWGWNPVTQVGCEIDDVTDPENYCHETSATATNGGWGWNPITQQGCMVVDDSENNYEEVTEIILATGESIGYGEGIIENQKDQFTVGEEIHFGISADITVSHTWRIEAWHDGNLWWGQNSDYRNASEHSFHSLMQTANVAGTYTFKVFFDTGNGMEFVAEKGIIAY